MDPCFGRRSCCRATRRWTCIESAGTECWCAERVPSRCIWGHPRRPHAGGRDGIGSSGGLVLSCSCASRISPAATAVPGAAVHRRGAVFARLRERRSSRVSQLSEHHGLKRRTELRGNCEGCMSQHQSSPFSAAIPLFSSRVSMHPKRDAAAQLRSGTKRPVPRALGRGHSAAHSVPDDELAAHVHAAWAREPSRLELQAKRMIVAAAGRHIG